MSLRWAVLVLLEDVEGQELLPVYASPEEARRAQPGHDLLALRVLTPAPAEPRSRGPSPTALGPTYSAPESAGQCTVCGSWRTMRSGCGAIVCMECGESTGCG